MAPLLQAVAHALSQAQRPRTLMQNIGGSLVSNVNLRFINRVDPDGHAWLPLSPKTIAMKQKRGKSTLLMLYNEGEMQDSIAYNAGDDWVEVGTAMRYGAYHETGTSRMPRRSFLLGDFNAGRLGADDESDVLEVINEYLAGSFGPP
ncbi:MAG: phage virion morphogenesis protein [Burkholderiaceae bacterium]